MINIMTLAESVAAVEDRHQSDINKTPSEIREERLSELEDKLIEARTTYTYAPENLSRAEKEYYTFKDGEPAFTQSQIEKYKREGIDIKKEMMLKHEQDMSKSLQSLSYYESQRTYIKNVNIIKLTLLNKILAKIKEIQSETANKDTNNRKTFYMAQEQEWLTMLIQFINFALISFTIVFIIYSVREHNVTSVTYFLVIFLIFVIFYVEMIVAWVRTIPLSLNVYTSWTEEADQSTFLFWAVVMVVMFLFTVIYSNNNDINNYFNSV